MPLRASNPVVEQRRPALAAGVGVVVPCDMALDRELWRWTPAEVSLHLTRLPLTPTVVDLETVALMGDTALVATTTAGLKPVAPAAVLYACTSGSFVHGAAGERALVDAMYAAGAAAALTTSGALSTALRALGVRRAAIATPYDAAITSRLAAYLAELDLAVVGESHLGLSERVWTVPYDVTAQLVRDANTAEAEAVVVSCTNLPTYDVIDELEAELGKPVVTANQASMWAVLHAVGHPPVGDQRLLGERPDTVAAPRPAGSGR